MTSTEPDGGTRWAPTRAFGRAILLIAATVLMAVFLGRPDAIVLIAPIALGAGFGLRHRPRATPLVEVATDSPNLSEGEKFTVGVHLGNADAIRYDLVVTRMSAALWLRVGRLDRPFASSIEAGGQVSMPLDGHALRWGRHQLGPVIAHAVAADGLLVSPVGVGRAIDMKVYPHTEVFDANDAMPRAAGMTGFHRSRRPGEGGELAGVRAFGPGDRLRRIDWRVSLRTRQLHVAATLSDRDAEVNVLLDLLNEAGRSDGIYGARSVLDTTVRAAAGIGEHYLHRGDRVSFVEYGFRGRRLRAATGHRAYLTSLEWLLDVQASNTDYDIPAYMYGSNVLSPNALVVVLSPLIDNRSAAMLARLVRGGRFVVAIDTLPPELLANVGNPSVYARGSSEALHGGDFAIPAARLWRMDRANTIAQLREHGVPIVSWAGAGSLDEVLRQVSRAAAAPKTVAR